ncbi:hypothetical protein F0562_003564 [Nyssa sinensis]|uniref:PGG domain-containing protein n=1 Tax=Nyssa sinensis TaxID=561372 RepID=A0A5J5BVU5_9ASTE|nr:hypothetical protein F0562_003564 [Nyssa sinensis]
MSRRYTKICGSKKAIEGCRKYPVKDRSNLTRDFLSVHLQVPTTMASSAAHDDEWQREKHYQQLYEDIDQGNWERAISFLESNPEAIEGRITEDEDTPLISAVKRGVKIHFLEKLVEQMSPEQLALDNAMGSTALHAAAVRGNTNAARLFVKKNPLLPFIRNYGGSLPLHLAALRGKREMTNYLWEEVTSYHGEKGKLSELTASSLIHHMINARFYDLAAQLLESYPRLVWEPECPLKLMVQDPSAFRSGLRFNIWQNLIYFCAPLKSEDLPISGFQKLHAKFWNVLEILVPHIKHIGDTKLLHCQVRQLVNHICKKVVLLDSPEAYSILGESFILATKNGIHEVVEVILKKFPSAIGFKDEDNNTAFQLAIMYRHEIIFNIINQYGGQEEFLSDLVDNKGNNILHLAGYLARENRLNLMSPAILQVQRELQWYKEVERLVLPAKTESKNSDDKTPLMVFIKEHSSMITNEQQWMKGMANSCTVAATLIAGVAFAAALTIPGGNNDAGFPILTKEASFMIFNISNIVALFSSLSTVIIFLAILISRYTVNDFLYALPRRLIMGLLALFLSITSMIVSFSAAVYLVSPQRKPFIILTTIFASVPVTLFFFLQFPLLLNIMKSTYFPRIFSSHKSNKES